MSSNPDWPKRQSVRSRGYDYAWPGYYFVTVCTLARKLLFGEITAGQMRLNEYGMVVHKEWYRTPRFRPEVVLDAFVVMPNHIHGIIRVQRATRHVAPTGRPAGVAKLVLPQQPKGPNAASIGAILGQIKSVTTKRINDLRGTPGETIWQRNYL